MANIVETLECEHTEDFLAAVSPRAKHFKGRRKESASGMELETLFSIRFRDEGPPVG